MKKPAARRSHSVACEVLQSGNFVWFGIDSEVAGPVAGPVQLSIVVQDKDFNDMDFFAIALVFKNSLKV